MVPEIYGDETNVMYGSLWAAVKGCNRQGGLYSKHSFLIVLETGKSKVKAPVELVSGEGSLHGLWMVVFSR
jgi:hypothetical protein